MKFNDALDNVKVYEAGKPIELVVREYGVKNEDVVKLASNENPYGCSALASKAIAEAASKACLYPDDSMFELKEKLSKRFGVAEKEIIVGAGSDQVIEFAIHSKCNSNSKILTNKITFAMYDVYAAQIGAEVIKTDSIHHDLAQFEALYKEHKPEMIFLCVPNNPTGDALDKEEVYNFIKQVDKECLVVVDCAYMEYARFKDPKKAIDAADLIHTFENVLYLGTFSKAYGLGGMRVGYGIAKELITTQLYKLRPPFNITTLSLQAAIAACDDEAFVEDSIAKNFEEMKRYEAFAKEEGLEFIESYTNFITLVLPQSLVSKEVAFEMLKKGMIVRDLTGYGMNAIRVTIGTSIENDKFFKIYKEVVSH